MDMNDERWFGPKVDHHDYSEENSQNIEHAERLDEPQRRSSQGSAMGSEKDKVMENGVPKRLSVELPVELQGVDRPRKRSSWFSEMCLGRETSLNNNLELSTNTPASSISGPDGKSSGRGGGGGVGVGSRLRASIFSVLGKLGRSPF